MDLDERFQLSGRQRRVRDPGPAGLDERAWCSTRCDRLDDASGNLWLFGGSGYDATNAGYGTLGDLWEYKPSTGEWTWQGGPDTEADPTTAQGVYGTQGQPAASNLPGPRSSAMTWTDASGNFWMFGGFGYDSIGIFGDLNDLWEYSLASGEWTWKSGCNLSWCVDGFGGFGQTAPGARDSAVAWTDGSGNFWLFGGSGVDTHDNTGTLNDLWKYTLTTGAWTLEGGSLTFGSISGFAGVYGTLGQSAKTNMPGSRYGGIGWTDASGNLWLFGGDGYDSAATFQTPFQGWLNDLWKYDPSTGNWTWEGGSNLENASGRVRHPWTAGSNQRTRLAICCSRVDRYQPQRLALWRVRVRFRQFKL